MPTKDEMDELTSLPNEKTELNGIKGRLFTGANGATLFLPFAGYRGEDELGGAGVDGYYWSATASGLGWDAYCLTVRSVGTYWYDYYRDWGFTVRPVLRTK